MPVFLSISTKEVLMKRVRLLTCVCALLLSSASVHAQIVTEGPSRYVAPQQITSNGQAPGMKVQLLSDQGEQKEYAVIFSTGDEAYSGLRAFAQKYNITSAHFTAIGAISGATLGWLDTSRKSYKLMPFSGQMEVVSMSGDIALSQGKPFVHTHAVLGLPDGTTRGGHVVEMFVHPTLEVMVTVDPKSMQRVHDPETDMTIITPQSGR
jgi:predicted DNA-binding protein with PD1-like motif